MKKKIFWYEFLHSNVGQFFTIDKIIFKKKTKYQNLLIFYNSFLGRVMILDNIVQTTEKDEFIYHEMITHIPLVTNYKAKKILIIGGSDGGVLREVVKHKNIEQIYMVEIDKELIKYCKKYLPNHSAGSYNDKRLKLIIEDGNKFVNKTKEKFDVIISDCTDPVGPGKNLFDPIFYKNCANILNKNGIFVSQNGIFLFQKEEIINSFNNLKKYFKDVYFYQASIPTYYGGVMNFSWSTQNILNRKFSSLKLKKILMEKKLNCFYYNYKIHLNSFALPQYMNNIINNNLKI
ncbi:polyamine aminopropyltransferase [Enterobacterales bacterium endosymbiont of Anomoneura mori]|uniref:polyamine aminopropyltransferase n=1 Tax=Enterobacterales bacterium endosymbiont of Anomoneura mori TaxID=3132096 RepID=UPI00399D100F